MYLVVGMENALRADYGFTAATATAGEDPAELTPYKAQYVLEAHRRFLVSYLDGLLQEDLRTLWRQTAGFCDPRQDVRAYDAALAALSGDANATLVRHSLPAVRELLRSGEDHRRVTVLCRTYAHADTALLRDVKAAVLDGVRAFETHEADVVERAGADLLRAARAPLDVVADYHRRLAGQTSGHGIAAVPGEETVPADRGLPGHGGPPI
ncbi:hypothetical protein [Dactylosporangium cerinum]